MRYEQIDRMVRKANPFPNHDALVTDSPALLYERGEDEMDTQIQTDRAGGPGPSRNWWAVGLVAAAVALVVGVLAVILADDSQPVAAPATDLETAAAYVNAVGALDLDLADSYASEDVTVGAGEDGNEDLRGWAAYEEAVGGGFEATSCVDNGSNFTCPISYNNDWGRALEVGPFSFGPALINVTDGEVTFARLQCCEGTSEYWEAAAYPFGDFLEANGYGEPEVADGVDWSQTEEGIESYRRWTEEFVAEHSS